MSDFQEWVDKHDPIEESQLPLTHIARSLRAVEILEKKRISPRECKHFREALAYFFYGRPAYRVTSDATIQIEASCPCCFLFKSDILARAKNIHAFDTGAFFNRLYSHVLDEDFKVEHFSLGDDPERIARLISASFESQGAYFDADRSRLRNADDAAEAWELSGRAYLTLLASPGRNEPDDRICSIEVTFGDPVLLDQNLLAVVVPHTFWDGDKKAPFLSALPEEVTIIPYRFIPGRHPEYYQAQIEGQVRAFYEELGLSI
ncbi:hypothetical protein [Qipengyuania sp.]|uniref:hypothetical protein n=1 Tax=Qipengyuania sp. TaxID=2004515 RepID=UPI0035154E24